MVHTHPVRPKPAAVLVIGGGIAGMRSARDLADIGLQVYQVEQSPCLGGRVAQLGFIFPQHDCVLCRRTPDHGYGCTRPSISPAYIQHNQHPNIEIWTTTNVVDRVVIVGCSNRTHELLFQRTIWQAGLNPYFLELVNLRDQSNRVHDHQPELAK